MPTSADQPENVRFGLWYDFRNPDPTRPFSRYYREVLEQISWLSLIHI